MTGSRCQTWCRPTRAQDLLDATLMRMSKFCILNLLVLFFFGCSPGGGSSGTSTEASPQKANTCSSSQLNSYGKTKSAVQDWILWGDQAHENYAISSCTEFMKLGSQNCKLDCSLANSQPMLALCPSGNGQEIKIKDLYDNCKYFFRN